MNNSLVVTINTRIVLISIYKDKFYYNLCNLKDKINNYKEYILIIAIDPFDEFTLNKGIKVILLYNIKNETYKIYYIDKEYKTEKIVKSMKIVLNKNKIKY